MIVMLLRIFLCVDQIRRSIHQKHDTHNLIQTRPNDLDQICDRISIDCRPKGCITAEMLTVCWQPAFFTESSCCYVIYMSKSGWPDCRSHPFSKMARNVNHWQHDAERYLKRCWAVCCNSSICQLSWLFIAHLNLKPFGGFVSYWQLVSCGFDST